MMHRAIDLLWELYHWLLRVVDPTHPVSLALRAERAMEAQQWEHAFELSNGALKKRDDLVAALFVRALARLHLDDYRGALHDLNRFLARADEPPAAAYYWRGWLYVHRAEWRMALADFDRVLDRTPDEPLLHYWRTYALWQRGEWDAMRDSLAHLNALSPDHALVWELRGHLHVHEGTHREAEDAYSRALAEGWESPDLHYNRAVARRQMGQSEAAREDLHAIFQLDPHNVWAHLELSNLAFDEGAYEESLEHLRAALAQDAEFAEARFSEAATLLAMGEYDAARERLAALADTFPDSPLVVQLQGDLYSEEGRAGAAATAYTRALTLAPDDGALRLKLAGEWIALERWEAAEEEIERVLRTEPELPQAHALRADLFRYSNRPAAMRAALERVLMLEPENTWALAYRASHRYWEGDPAGAEADFGRALALDAQQGWIWAFRGHFYLRQGRLRAANDDFQRAITLDPRDPWIRRQWANLLARCGQRACAAEVLDCLIEEHPRDGFARLARAELCLKAGEWGAAREQFAWIVAAEHELAWLAHAALAVLAEGAERARHLAQAEQLCPEPTFWGMSPAIVLAQRALVAWLRGEPDGAIAHLADAREQLEPGERLWPALRPLFQKVDAVPLLLLLPEPHPALTESAA